MGRLGSHHSTSRCASEHVRTVLRDLEYVSICCNGRIGSRISDRSLGRFTKVCISKDSRESPQVHHIRFVALLTSSELLCCRLCLRGFFFSKYPVFRCLRKPE